jgi:hypothetical protein
MSARKSRSDPMDDLMRWRRSWPDGGNASVDADSKQKLHAILQRARLLGKVREYCGIRSGSIALATPSREVRDYLRWEAVVEVRHEHPKMIWNEMYQAASKRLSGSPRLAGSARTMKRAYIEIQRLCAAAAKVGP